MLRGDGFIQTFLIANQNCLREDLLMLKKVNGGGVLEQSRVIE